MTEVTKAMDRVRRFFRQRPGISIGGFCKRAELSRNTLYGIDDSSWNPRAETLQRCLKLIDILESEEAVRRGRKARPREQPQAA